jgi:hypothetical protein
MIEAVDRQPFLEALRPPDGYEFQSAIATTCALDLAALLEAAAVLGGEAFDAAPSALLEGALRVGEHLHVFCQSGAVRVPPPGGALWSVLEGSVIAARAPKGGLFHPKLWILRFQCPDPQAPIAYRVVVGSRNLTLERGWDLAVALEGEVGVGRSVVPVNHPLADLVAALPSLATERIPPVLGGRIGTYSEELRRVRFRMPGGVDSIAFRYLGVGDGAWHLPGSLPRLLVVSPFVSERALRRLAGSAEETLLVTSARALASTSAAVRSRFARLLTLGEADPSGQAERVEEAPLHARLYVADDGRNGRVWIGSANATDGAYGGNVEVLLELVGKRAVLGVDAFLSSGGPLQLTARLRDAPPVDVAEVDELGDTLRDRIASAHDMLLGVGLHAAVEGGPDGWTLELRADPRDPLELERGVEVRCRPLALPPERAICVDLRAAARGEGLARFDGLAVEELSSFFVFEVTARASERGAEHAFVRALRLEAAPPQRAAAILDAARERVAERGRDTFSDLLPTGPLVDPIESGAF